MIRNDASCVTSHKPDSAVGESLTIVTTSSSISFIISYTIYNAVTMGTASILSAEDKAKVKKAIPTSSSTNKIITAAVARVYIAKPDSST